MKTGIQTQVIRYAAVVMAIAAITAIDFRLHVNHTTVALMFLVTVLLTSAYWGLRYAVVMAVVATAAFNFFFLPPYRNFHDCRSAKLGRAVRVPGDRAGRQQSRRAGTP